jgi:hypothetical protein
MQPLSHPPIIARAPRVAKNRDISPVPAQSPTVRGKIPTKCESGDNSPRFIWELLGQSQRVLSHSQNGHAGVEITV